MSALPQRRNQEQPIAPLTFAQAQAFRLLRAAGFAPTSSAVADETTGVVREFAFSGKIIHTYHIQDDPRIRPALNSLLSAGFVRTELFGREDERGEMVPTGDFGYVVKAEALIAYNAWFAMGGFHVTDPYAKRPAASDDGRQTPRHATYNVCENWDENGIPECVLRQRIGLQRLLGGAK